MYVIKTNQPVNGGLNSTSRIDNTPIYEFESAKEFFLLNPDLKLYEEITIPDEDTRMGQVKKQAWPVDIINEKVIEKSTLNNFTDVCYVNSLTPVINYIDLEYTQSKDLNKTWDEMIYKKQERIIEIHPTQVAASVTQEQLQDLNMNWGIDVLGMVQEVLVNESAMCLTKEYMKKLALLAEIPYRESYTKWEKLKTKLYKIFKKTYEKKIKIKSDQDLARALVYESNRMFQRNRRGPANFIVCNIGIGTLIQDSTAYTYASTEAKTSNGAPYLIGTLAGMQIYINPYMSWQDKTIYLGRKSKIEETGLNAYFYKEGTSALKIIAEGTGAPKLILKINYAILPVGERPQYEYSKIVIDNKSKMIF